MPDLHPVPEPEARLNVTYNGQNGDYPDPVSFDLADGDIKQIITEAIQTGYIPGIDPVENVDLGDFVVDRFNATDDLPQRLMIRPKTPFGAKKKDRPSVGILIGTQKRTVKAAEKAILNILEADCDESTKVAALQSFTDAVAVKNTTLSGNTITW